MTERPILFSAPMVRAILDGRKTQTRRIMKPQPVQNGFGPPDPVYDIPCHCDAYPPSAMLWPDERGGMLNGDAGHPWLGVDRLWVKETWNASTRWEERRPTDIPTGVQIFYRADYDEAMDRASAPWRPSIFMRRWMSRITLELIDVRAERLNAISEDDAIAEGIYRNRHGVWHWRDDSAIGGVSAVDAYRLLWESINGEGAWQTNPFVWVLTFRRVE